MITPEAIEQYCSDHSTQSSPLFAALAEETLQLVPQAAHMQVGTLEGALLSLMVKITGAKRVLEFGTFTGCSSLHFALALPSDGIITTLDRDPRAVTVAKKYWAHAGVSMKIESIVNDAKTSAAQILADIQSGAREKYDLAFIDADKGGYVTYFEASLKAVKPGGLIMVDNLLWKGRVLNPTEPSDLTIHQFNERYRADPRVEQVLLPVRDGISLFWVKP